MYRNVFFLLVIMLITRVKRCYIISYIKRRHSCTLLEGSEGEREDVNLHRDN